MIMNSLFHVLNRHIAGVRALVRTRGVRFLSDSTKTGGQTANKLPDVEDVPLPPELDRHEFSRRRSVRYVRYASLTFIGVFMAYTYYDTLKYWPHLNPFSDAKMIDMVPPSVLAEREAAANNRAAIDAQDAIKHQEN
jgi:hypothetical protein